MKTARLFYTDAMCDRFRAEVLHCRKTEQGYEVILDQTAFYPEGGGQPCDRGSLDDSDVLYVEEREDEIIHLVNKELMEGSTVQGQIDGSFRFDLMQQHSGEHMVSGLVHQKYGYDNVGFHMGTDVVTIDFNGMLTMDDLLQIENEVNHQIWKNTEIEITWPSEEELRTISYRSKKELSGDVRIVTFPGVDICACCGTHVRYTGEIGMVKILSCTKFRTGVRVEMISGKRVLSYLQKISNENHQISKMLSAKEFETSSAVSRIKEENQGLHNKIFEMREELFSREAEKQKDAGNILLFYPELDADSLRRLTDMVMRSCGGRCAVFSDQKDGTYKYAMGETDGDLRSYTKDMNTVLNGRGGGKPFFVQGSVSASEEEIRKFFG